MKNLTVALSGLPSGSTLPHGLCLTVPLRSGVLDAAVVPPCYANWLFLETQIDKANKILQALTAIAWDAVGNALDFVTEGRFIA